MRTCKLCGTQINRNNVTGICSRSKCLPIQHQEYAKLHGEKFAAYRREWGLRKYHGITFAQWQEMYDAQGGRCYLCEDALPEDKGPGKAPVIDHDHACCPKGRSCSKCRRGLACFKCNVVLGMADDNPERLARIAHNFQKRAQADMETEIG